MRIEQLKQVIQIAQSGSFNKAASELYISQSNLSLSIKSLEAETGHQIFIRTSKGAELTAFGSEFLNHAIATCNQYDLANEFCHTFSQVPPMHLSISSQYMRFTNLLFIRMIDKYSTSVTDFSFKEGSFMEIVRDVVSNRSEIGIVVLSNNQKKTTLNLLNARGLSYMRLALCPAAVTIGPHNPLYSSDKTSITYEELRPYPVVMYEDATFDFASELSQFQYYTYKNRITVSDRSTLHEILEHTSAYSIAVYAQAQIDTCSYYNNIRSLPLAYSPLSFEIGWIHNTSHTLSKLADEYIEMIKQSKYDL